MGEWLMYRRAFLKGAAASIISAPAIAQNTRASTLRLVPHADLSNFDPIWSVGYVARNAGFLVWDTLYGMDARFKLQRQMIEAEEISSDNLNWTFHLRSGLKFHDGAPVLAKDVIASINRWAIRDQMGQMIKAIAACSLLIAKA
jgi:peptide/nickel transport system substrate-binding protein